MVRLFINVGKKDRIKPGDILGAIAGESGMPGRLVGAIDMYDKYTFVEVPAEYGKEVLNAMKNAKIKGRSVNMEPANSRFPNALSCNPFPFLRRYHFDFCEDNLQIFHQQLLK